MIVINANSEASYHSVPTTSRFRLDQESLRPVISNGAEGEAEGFNENLIIFFLF